jgi:hypothetical protein
MGSTAAAFSAGFAMAAMAAASKAAGAANRGPRIAGRHCEKQAGQVSRERGRQHHAGRQSGKRR